MRYAMRNTTAVLLSLALLGCLSSQSAQSGQPASRGDRRILTGAELREQHYNSAYEAIEALRGNWLVARGPDSFASPSVVLVYMDNVKLGGIETLRAVEISTLESIEHLDANSATARWGVGHGAGVILITTLRRRDSAPSPE